MPKGAPASGVLPLRPGCLRDEEPQTQPLGLGLSRAAPAQHWPRAPRRAERPGGTRRAWSWPRGPCVGRGGWALCAGCRGRRVGASWGWRVWSLGCGGVGGSGPAQGRAPAGQRHREFPARKRPAQAEAEAEGDSAGAREQWGSQDWGGTRPPCDSTPWQRPPASGARPRAHPAQG